MSSFSGVYEAVSEIGLRKPSDKTGAVRTNEEALKQLMKPATGTHTFVHSLEHQPLHRCMST
jgi:hypothetical protein